MAFEYEEALFRVGRMPGERLPEIAVAMLAAGVDTQPVRELTGLVRPTLREAAELFEAALVALGRPRLTAAQAGHVLRERALRRTATGEVPPIEGAHELWAVWHLLGYPEELSAFVYLEDLWAENLAQRAEIEREIRETAAQLLARDASRVHRP